MKNKSCTEYNDVEILNAVEEYGTITAAAKVLQVDRSRLSRRVSAIKAEQYSHQELQNPVSIRKPRKGRVKRFIFTSAQSKTDIHQEFFENLLAYADYMDAELHISGYTYSMSAYDKSSTDPEMYHESLRPHLTSRSFEVGGSLLFCGEMNTSPTTVNPLSSLEDYTKRKSGIFPHPKIMLRSVPTMRKLPSKIIMTTGTVTKPNYLPKKAGFKAEFHHVLGAVIVELDGDNRFFCRHLIADEDGSFQDLTRYVGYESVGDIREGHPVEAITWGDIHHEMLDPEVAYTSWGIDPKTNRIINRDNLLDILQPRYSFYHDVTDFRARNHHSIGDHHFLFQQHRHKNHNVEKHMHKLAEFLETVERPFCENVIVESNHDLAMLRWLKEADYRRDPENAIFFLKCQLAVYKSLERNDEEFSILEQTLRQFEFPLDRTIFLCEEDSYQICLDDQGNGIENALHGHRGANGARGAPRQFMQTGYKTNTAHTHSANIIGGVYTAGTSSKLNLGYNKGGLSSWNHSHIITYPNGKRTVLTIIDGKPWA